MHGRPARAWISGSYEHGMRGGREIDRHLTPCTAPVFQFPLRLAAGSSSPARRVVLRPLRSGRARQAGRIRRTRSRATIEHARAAAGMVGHRAALSARRHSEILSPMTRKRKFITAIHLCQTVFLIILYEFFPINRPRWLNSCLSVFFKKKSISAASLIYCGCRLIFIECYR